MTSTDAHAGDEMRMENHVVFIQVFLAVVVGGGFLFACLGLPYLNDEEPGGFEITVATVVSIWALAIAGYRRSLVLDRARGEVVRRMGWFVLQRTRRFPLSAYERLEIRSSTVNHDEHRPASEQRLSSRSTSYPVYLAGPDGAELMLSTHGSHQTSCEEAVKFAEFLDLPLVDTASGG